MDFKITHHFEASPDEVADALIDEDFQASLADVASLSEREVILQEERRDGSILRRIRCVLDIDVSGAAKKFLGGAKPSWIEEARWDPGARRWTWTIHPEVAAELMSAGGHIDVGKQGSGACRTVSGSVKVKVPLYGSKVEGWIVSGIEAAYDEEAERLAEWLERENRSARSPT
ncbi:MAG: DUF2505 domain-containing protein [Actinomycetota bacterium]|nr:DUF2505 domain-containing protein [Actinomycetota bacterium]